jgi:hypothetical protein
MGKVNSNLTRRAVMDDTVLDRLFPGYHKVAKGVSKMIRLWKGGSCRVTSSKSDSSLFFIYRKGSHAFRVETATGGRKPRLVIYTGLNESRRGSPLVKGANLKDVQKLKKDFDISENKDGKSGWPKSLGENTPPAFYTDFVEHALEMVRGR